MKYPDEFSKPAAEEFSINAAEIALPPDEFHQKTAPTALKKKRKGFRFAAGVIAAAVLVGAYWQPSESPVSYPTEPPETLPTFSPASPSTEPPTTPSTAVEEPTVDVDMLDTYPNAGDTCIITVYGDYFDVETMGSVILMETTVKESTFTEMTLPKYPVYDGCSVVGYVIEYSGSSADFSNTGYNPKSKAFAVDVGLTLTLDELQLVPVWEEDQIRHVFVHPVWVRNEGSVDWKTAPVVTLNNGESAKDFPLDLPSASAAKFYACFFVPEMEGYTFAGWYNEQDERVYFLCAEELFQDYKEGTNEIDWFKPTNITLTAKWIPNS